MKSFRFLVCLLLLLASAAGVLASGKASCGTVTAVSSADLPENCCVVKFSATGDMRLYRRDVCTVVRAGGTLGRAVVLLAESGYAVFFPLFPGSLAVGDAFSVAQRKGFVEEEAFLVRVGGVACSAAERLKGEGGARLWNSLRFKVRHPQEPNLLHFWAGTLSGATLKGVDDDGYWHVLPLAGATIPVLSWQGDLLDSTHLEDGAEMDVVVGTSGGEARVAAIVVRPPLAPSALLERLAPRVPVTFDSPVPLARPGGSSLEPLRCVRQVRQCRVESLDLVNSRATLTTYTGEALRVKVASPLINIGDCSVVDPRTLLGAPSMDMVCHSGPEGAELLAVGRGDIVPEGTPRLLGSVSGPAENRSGTSYYPVKLAVKDGIHLRDTVTIWRKSVRLGEGMLVSKATQAILYVRAGTPVLQPGDQLIFSRRAKMAYIDADRFANLHTHGSVRRTTDARDALDLDAYQRDGRVNTPDMYAEGPFQVGERPTRLGSLAVNEGDGARSVFTLPGYQKVLKSIKTELEVSVESRKDGALVHFTVTFKTPIKKGPEATWKWTTVKLETILNRDEFKLFVVAWNKAIKAWRYSPSEMQSEGNHGAFRDCFSPQTQLISFTSHMVERQKFFMLTFADPRPKFQVDDVEWPVEFVSVSLSEANVNRMSGTLEVIKADLGW